MLIDGIHVPLAEPFYRDGALYLRKLEHNVRRYSLSPVSGLVALPPGGEASCLSDEEKKQFLQSVVEAAAPEKVLVAGVECDSVKSAVALAQAAADAKFDALLLAAPRNWQTLIRTDGEVAIAGFFATVADAVELPVMLWSGSAGGGYALPTEMVGSLAQHSNIIGIYCAGLDETRRAAIAERTSSVRREVEVTPVFAPVTRRMKKPEAVGAATFVSASELEGGSAVATAPPVQALKTRIKTIGFQIMGAGKTTALVTLLESGMAGALPDLATCAPQAVYEAYAAHKDGDPALAREKAERLEKADEVVAELGVAAVKYGCDLNGYFGGMPRLPRFPLTAEKRELVEAALKELRN